MLPLAIQNLAQKFRAFPGVGSRSSQKLALDFLQLKEEEYLELVASLQNLRKEVQFCTNCGFFAQNQGGQAICEICKDKTRNSHQICVLEKPTDVLTVEKSQIYRGCYHVLNNLISPLDNIFAQDTSLTDLLERRIPQILSQTKSLNNQTKGQVELILFFKSGFAAEATTAYLREAISNLGLTQNVLITRLAQGLPLYYNPDTLDQATMAKALEDRRGI